MTTTAQDRFSWPFLIFFLAACYPFTFGTFANLPVLLWIEWMAPIAFIIGIHRLMKMHQPVAPYGARAPIIATSLLLVLSLIHMTFHPVSSVHLLEAGARGGGLRVYFTIAIGFLTLLYSTWMSRYWVKSDRFWEKLLWYTLGISLIVGYTRLITNLLGMDMPLLAGVYGYHEELVVKDKAYRIGGLSEAAVLGLSALAGIYYKRKWSLVFIILGLALLFLLIMGGGRAATVGVAVAIFVYLALVRREIGRTAIISALVLTSAIIAAQFTVFEKQFGRITQIEGGLEVSAPGRYHSYEHMLSIFLDHPLIGKGVGSQYIDSSIPIKFHKMLSTGGHGSYTSILMIFGVGGAFFLAVTLFRTLLAGISYIRKYTRDSASNMDQRVMLCFIVFQFSCLSVEFITGGSGYNNMRLYLLAGTAAGIFSRLKYGA